MLNSLLCLSVKLSLLHIWMIALPVEYYWFFFPFIILNISGHSLLACRVSDKKLAHSFTGPPLYITSCFFLAAFNILSLCLISAILIKICLGLALFVLVLFGTLCLLDLKVCFPFLCEGNFPCYVCPFPSLSLSSFWDPYNANVSTLDVVLEVS